MIHAIKQGYAPFATPEDFTRHVAYLKRKQDVLWIDTYAAVGKYKAEAESAQLSAQAAPGAGKVTFTLTSELDAAVYDQPLTVVVDVPSKPAAATAKRGSTALPVALTDKALQVEVIPGKEPVVVEYH